MTNRNNFLWWLVAWIIAACLVAIAALMWGEPESVPHAQEDCPDRWEPEIAEQDLALWLSERSVEFCERGLIEWRGERLVWTASGNQFCWSAPEDLEGSAVR